jgi:hypothetical protein
MSIPDIILLTAVWEFFCAVGTVIGIVAIVLFAFPIINDMWGIARTGGMFGLVVAILMLSAVMILSIVGGIGLLMKKEWGRVLSVVQAGFSLLLIPIGTVIGVLILSHLTKPEIRQYFIPPAK